MSSLGTVPRKNSLIHSCKASGAPCRFALPRQEGFWDVVGLVVQPVCQGKHWCLTKDAGTPRDLHPRRIIPWARLQPALAPGNVSACSEVFLVLYRPATTPPPWPPLASYAWVLGFPSLYFRQTLSVFRSVGVLKAQDSQYILCRERC